ncbi:MAG: O-antigen ligase family protein [Bacteroidia bacterium]|nr:O-antigen ligase family protein [Bacteroidia bacterium]
MLEVRGAMAFGSILFMIGAITSTIGAGINLGYEYFELAIKVLPNYLYWGFLVLTLGNLALKTVQLDQIYKMIFYGLVASCLSFFLLKPILEGLPFFRNVTQNNFAFILISFGPMGVYYVQLKWRNGFYTILAILGISFCGIISGSRSGSLLVFLGCALAVSIESWLKIMILAFLGFVLYLITPQLLSSPSIKMEIYNLNERTYDLLYETDATLATDRSFLTRLAMIEKGLNIFEEYPIAGIGIGNFSSKSFDIDFEFEGSEYIEGKEEQLESKTNPHNSYISFLSEGGLVLFIPAIFLMFYPIGFFITHYNKLSGTEKALFIGVLFMCIHAWFIAGMINVYGWFLLGITNALIQSKNDSRILLP